MNTEQRGEQHDTSKADMMLPELSDERIDEIERSLFSGIAKDRTARRARRGRFLLAGGAAAAVIVVAAVIAPSVMSGIGASSEAGSAVAPVSGQGSPEMAPDGARDLGGADTNLSQSADESASREIITNASATVIVDDVATTATAVGESAEARGGYVESMSIGRAGEVLPVEPMPGGVVSDSFPYTPDGAWITVRVSADQLSDMVRELSEFGEVSASSINRQDVTEQAVDLRARIGAAQASVDRLTALMAQAGSVADLIAAEAALSERQATLESYQQQLESLESQVALSGLTVTLTPRIEQVEADPAGFVDGLASGWNGLIAALNGIVVALGFLLPWLVVLAIAGLIVWGIVRLVRAGRQRPTSSTPPGVEGAQRDESR